MKFKFLLLLPFLASFNSAFSQAGFVACEKFTIDRIYNNSIFQGDVLNLLVTNHDTTYWVYARIDIISLTGDTIASAPSCGCSLLAGGGTDSLMIAVDKPFMVPDNFSCYVVVGNTSPAPCKKLYQSGKSDAKDLTKNTSHLQLYPNPAKESVTVEFTGYSSTTSSLITIVNLQGQKVLTQPLTVNKSNLDISALNQGIYFVQLYTDGALAKTKKLVIR